MTKAELIRKIAKRSGVPDSEAKVFFEIFLRKASAMLQPGEALKIQSLGYFQLRQGVIKDTASRSGSEMLYADLMVYSPVNSDAESHTEDVIFNVPQDIPDKYSEIDSYFSISIGKPVIPLKGVQGQEIFIPPTGNELHKLIESKVEKLLSDTEKIDKYTKGNELLVIESRMPRNEQFEFKWDASAQHIEKTGKGKQHAKSEGEEPELDHIAWDFGDDLLKEIEEEAILDTGLDETSRTSEFETDKSLTWDFQPPDTEETEQFGSDEEVLKDEPDVPHSEAELGAPEEEIKDTDDSGHFQRVKSLTSEIRFKPGTDTKEGLTWDFGETSPREDEGIEEFLDSNLDLDLIEKEDFNTRESDSDSEHTEINELPEAQNEEKEQVSKSEADHKAKQKDYITQTKERKYSSSKKGSPLVFFIALATIVVVAAALYIYVNKIKLGPFGGEKAAANVTAAAVPVVIDRSYDVPVTYPYPKEAAPAAEGAIESGAVKSIAAGDGSSESQSNLSAVLNSSSKAGSGKTSSVSSMKTDLQKVEDNIYRSGGKFVVQVSSWKYKGRADKQAELYKKRGYVPFIEKAAIPGRGEWYRVRVGYFNTIAEARAFEKKVK